jgi:ferredoxin
MQAREAPVVVICDDLGAPPVQLDLGELAERVCRQAPGTRVKVVPGSCQGPKALAGALGGIRPQRVVVGCRHAFDRRGELLCSLRRAGVARGGIEIVGHRPAGGQGGQAVVEEISLQQSAVLLRAAVARVTAVRLDVPVRERTGFSAGAISRRSLFGASNVARQAVAVFLPGSCGGGAACAACVLACPQQALSRDAGRVVVSADRCSGCGACVTACRNGAFSLPDADLDGLEAAFGVLVSEIWRGGAARGIAVACQQ